MTYLFILGNAPELAFAELKSFVISPQKIASNLVTGETDMDPSKLMKILGGTVKIAEILPEDVKLSEIIKGDFGISDFTGKVDLPVLCKDIKNETGKRFVLPRNGQRELSSVVVAKQKLTEIVLAQNLMAKTVAVQDFEDWGKRDYGRPEAEGHIGMLPPKVARMMVNIGVRGLSADSTVLDPFCGTGTILMEAFESGLKALGSDIDPKQIERSRKNLAWLGKTAELIISDARIINRKVSRVDAIVTEPDLGANNRSGKPAGDYLQKLYLDCLDNWKSILPPLGRVVIALPSTRENSNLVKTVIDKAKLLGYSLEQGPYEYYRPQAVVRRSICIFVYGTY